MTKNAVSLLERVCSVRFQGKLIEEIRSLKITGSDISFSYLSYDGKVLNVVFAKRKECVLYYREQGQLTVLKNIKN